ncbi:hypothetical protein RB195_000530 [Necator americanus]
MSIVSTAKVTNSTSNKSRKSKSLKKRDTCISKASFARILRNVSCRERAPSRKLRWSKHAEWALQIVAERYLNEVLNKTSLIARINRRITVKVSDITSFYIATTN